MENLVRLNKYIADCGVCSRRKADELIEQKHVKINGQTVTEHGIKVRVGEDLVQLRGEVVSIELRDKLYIILNKPRAVMSTVDDPQGRKTVIDCLKGIKERVYPVGRLDYLSEGLMIMTNDGDLTHKIMHPSYEITKTYEVKVFGIVTEKILNALRDGVQSDKDFLKPLSVRIIKQLPGKTWLEFRLNEGKNREIRRICEACNLTIDKLKRVSIGNLAIDGISPGEFKVIYKKDLLRLMGLNQKGEKVSDFSYQSAKKSVPKTKRLKFKSEAPKANQDTFKAYRKDSYYKTIEQRKTT